jgi:hypothetical protein
MRGEWVDPEGSITSHARSAPKTQGYRAFCPLRRMAQRLNATGRIAPEHVAAADLLRRDFDLARLGRANSEWLGVYSDPAYGPHGRTHPGRLGA